MRLAWLLALLPSIAGAQSDSKAVAVPTQGVDPMQLGAKCDGATDDAAAIAAAIKTAKAKGLPVLLPAATCAYGAVLTLDGVKMIGRGDESILWALDPSHEVIFLRGSGAEVRNLKLVGVKPTARAAPWEGSRIVAFGASDFAIDNVTIDGSTGTGVQTARAATNGIISNNRISNTLGDGIHITGQASYITIVGNVVDGTGDDGIAVVSYQRDPGLTHHITAMRNTVSNNKGGRSMSVVGGSDVLYEHNRLSNSGRNACLYLAQEDSWKTRPISNVIARYNTLSNCGSSATGHAAVMLFADSAENSGVQILRNDIAQSGQAGIRMFGRNTDVSIDGNRVSGARQALQLPVGVTATPYSAGAVGAQ
ncbi:MAG TPA: right-handed parallel beta-helix repeat-containing protein [Burkholderiaceae bacterium]|nr:right-handed parallel beta-helix repeat-containing protein [Burkholderiaceae bacterium]